MRLQAVDVTVAVDCSSVMEAFNTSFAKWPIDETKLGIPEDASPGHAETVYLSEGTAAKLPWVFKAHRKVIQVNNQRVRSLLAQVCVFIGDSFAVAGH